MAMDLRPTGSMLITNYLITLGILGAIIYLSIGQPKTYYYATPYNDHDGHGGSYESAMTCQSCHSEPFLPVVNLDCANTGCHSTYMHEYELAFAPPVYDVGWVALREKEPWELAGRRTVQASLVYHKLPDVQSLSCTGCHVTHQPPPAGVPKIFPHSDADLLPEGVTSTDCAACHNLNQAPPIRAHAELLASGIAKCWDCHHSSNSWSEEVVWVGKPAGVSAGEANSPIDGDVQGFASLPVPTPTAAPAPEAFNPFADAPAIVPDGAPAPEPSPTPAPRTAVELDWLTLWTDYEPGMSFSATGRPVLLLFSHSESLASNRFEIYFDRAREAVAYAAGNMTLVRVDAAKYPEVSLQYRLPGAPGLVRLDAQGRFHSRLFDDEGRVPEAKILQFLKNEAPQR